jgi:formamidopyrimidine-DNA glycosylase
MPELPEVETIVSDLKKVLPGLKIRDVWTDWKKMVKKPKSFALFRRKLLGKEILEVRRQGKNILIDLSGGITLLIHQKLTGHLLYGKYQMLKVAPPKLSSAGGKNQNGKLKLKNDKNFKWVSAEKGPLKSDPHNQFLHLVISLSNGRKLALSDLRKFAKVLIHATDKLDELEDLKGIGPDPLSKDFTVDKFANLIRSKKGKIKQVLMDQKIIAGIGNIYSDEILWDAGIHPLKNVQRIKKSEFKKIYQAIKKVLTRAIKEGGDSMSDYRRPSGKKGNYQNIQNAYQMAGKKCKRKDGGIIKRLKIGGRSAHFCPVHQK